jgi:phosphate transport system substrate-binding protein
MKMYQILKCWLAGLMVLAFAMQVVVAQTIEVDKRIPKYQKTTGISGNANSIGSDTMNNLMTLWLEGFRKYYPLVNVQIEGKGSSTAPPALIEGTAQFGPMSREMKSKEIDAFEKKYGFKPTEVRTSLDALAVFVHKDNPLQCLSIDQVDAIFSKTRKHGHENDIVTWGDVGLTGEWANQPIRLFGRNSASGTYGYFKSEALDGGDFKDAVKEQPGSASVVQGVTEDKFAIGYSGIGYKTSGVNALALSKKTGETCYAGSYDNVVKKTYPLARFLYLYIVNSPTKPMDPLVKEFLLFVLSYEGQEIVVKDGYQPLTYEVVMEERVKLEGQGSE